MRGLLSPSANTEIPKPGGTSTASVGGTTRVGAAGVAVGAAVGVWVAGPDVGAEGGAGVFVDCTAVAFVVG
jgi:hypothetical protein